MNHETIRRPLFAALVMLAAAASTGCGNDTFFEPPSVDVTGAWSFSADPANRPAIGDCSGELIGVPLPRLCDAFDLELVQSDGTVTTVAPGSACQTELTLTGHVSGHSMGAQVDFTFGIEAWFMLGAADVEGDTMSFELDLLTELGKEGHCVLHGRYLAQR